MKISQEPWKWEHGGSRHLPTGSLNKPPPRPPGQNLHHLGEGQGVRPFPDTLVLRVVKQVTFQKVHGIRFYRRFYTRRLAGRFHLMGMSRVTIPGAAGDQSAHPPEPPWQARKLLLLFAASEPWLAPGRGPRTKTSAHPSQTFQVWGGRLETAQSSSLWKNDCPRLPACEANQRRAHTW